MAKILIIEDDTIIRTLIEDALGLEGFETIYAENGVIGVELAKKSHPNLIICDIHMPEMNGYQVLASLRSDPQTALTPFIFLTAHENHEHIREGMNLGADDYITKPFRIPDLIKAVNTRLDRHASTVKPLEDLRQNISLALPHEMRTPLTAIIGFSQFLMNVKTITDASAIASMATEIHDNAIRLQMLIENYLLYADLFLHNNDPAKLTKWLAVGPIDLSFFLRESSRTIAKRNNRENDIVLKCAEMEIHIAARTLTKVFQELLSNALKFSEAGTPITIQVDLNEKEVIMSISDKGRGMTPDQIHDVAAFTQFQRSTFEQQGIGLGLALVKHLVMLNQGRFQIESALNQGTRVQVSLPIHSQ